LSAQRTIRMLYVLPPAFWALDSVLRELYIQEKVDGAKSDTYTSQIEAMRGSVGDTAHRYAGSEVDEAAVEREAADAFDRMSPSGRDKLRTSQLTKEFTDLSFLRRHLRDEIDCYAAKQAVPSDYHDALVVCVYRASPSFVPLLWAKTDSEGEMRFRIAEEAADPIRFAGKVFEDKDGKFGVQRIWTETPAPTKNDPLDP
ncbi:MAG: hypothetical protein WAW06_06015, partial [bacterium]